MSLAEPVLQIVSPFANFVGYLASSKEILSGIAGLFVGMKVFQIWSLAAKQRELAIEAEILALKTGQAVATSVMNPLAIAAGLLAGAATAALVYSSMKDGEIDPKKGPVLSGDFGSVQLNPRDKAMYGADGTIKVGTDLLKENTSRINPYTNNTQTSAPSPSIDISAMVNKMEQMFAKLQDRPVVVHSVVKTENNDVLASATNTSNRKTGYSIQ